MSVHRFLVLVLSLVGGGSAAGAAKPPNIVFILADDLGVFDLGCYGRTEHRTPHLDALAAEGLKFTAGFSACPVCSPTRAAILTGKYPARLHLTTFLPGRADAASQKLLHPTIVQRLPLEEVSLAERLRAAGYATAAIGKWHLGGPNFQPQHQGFDVAYAGTANTRPTATEGGKGEYDLTAKAEQFLTTNRDRPFFLYLCHNNPHIPLVARPERIARLQDRFNPTYAAVVEELDAAVGRLLAKLDELGLKDNTLVVFTSDNGGVHIPELKEPPPTHNGPYRAGKGFLYDGGIRVPVIARWPAVIAPGRRADEPLMSIDWVPTLTAIAGLPPVPELDGVDVSAVFRGGRLAERSLYWHVPHYTNQGSRPAGAVLRPPYKLVVHYEDDTAELYDTRSDVGEQTDLSARDPARAAALRKQFDDWLTAVKAQKNVPNPRFDAAAHRAIYGEFDVSRWKPRGDAVTAGAELKVWRERMDRAVKP